MAKKVLEPIEVVEQEEIVEQVVDTDGDGKFEVVEDEKTYADEVAVDLTEDTTTEDILKGAMVAVEIDNSIKSVWVDINSTTANRVTSKTEAMQVSSGVLIRVSSTLVDANGLPIHFEQNIAFVPNVKIESNGVGLPNYLK